MNHKATGIFHQPSAVYRAQVPRSWECYWGLIHSEQEFRTDGTWTGDFGLFRPNTKQVRIASFVHELQFHGYALELRNIQLRSLGSDASTYSCSRHATCLNTVGSYACTCNNGFHGDGVDCRDVDECQTGMHTCDLAAICTDTTGSFQCTCQSGYMGNGTTCLPLNECSMRTHNCHPSRDCIDTIGSFECPCRLGYVHTDQMGECDPNECALQVHNCHANASCIDSLGSYGCTCNTGYEGNGVLCADINECDMHTHNCGDGEDCVDTIGSHQCVCRVGYHTNGTSCVDFDECLLSTHNCNSASATCINTHGSFECACNVGYNGIACESINECALGTHNCHPDAKCTDTEGSFSCNCKSEFRGNGLDCTFSPTIAPQLDHWSAQVATATIASVTAVGVMSGSTVVGGGAFLSAQVVAASSSGSHASHGATVGPLSVLNFHGTGLIDMESTDMSIATDRECHPEVLYFFDTVLFVALAQGVCASVRWLITGILQLSSRLRFLSRKQDCNPGAWRWPFTLLGPRWELQVLNWQLLGLSQAFAAITMSPCLEWRVVGGLLISLAIGGALFGSRQCHTHLKTTTFARFQQISTEEIAETRQEWNSGDRSWSCFRKRALHCTGHGEWVFGDPCKERTFTRLLDPITGQFRKHNGIMTVLTLLKPIVVGLLFSMTIQHTASSITASLFSINLAVILKTQPYVSRVEMILEVWNAMCTAIYLATVAVYAEEDRNPQQAMPPIVGWIQTIILVGMMIVGALSTIYTLTMLVGDLWAARHTSANAKPRDTQYGHSAFDAKRTPAQSTCRERIHKRSQDGAPDDPARLEESDQDFYLPTGLKSESLQSTVLPLNLSGHPSRVISTQPQSNAMTLGHWTPHTGPLPRRVRAHFEHSGMLADGQSIETPPVTPLLYRVAPTRSAARELLPSTASQEISPHTGPLPMWVRKSMSRREPDATATAQKPPHMD